MAIDQAALAKRLKEARINCGITQEAVARTLGLPRTAIVQIEASNRSVSTLELTEFARLYRRPISSFLEEVEDEDVLVALCRAAEDFHDRPEMHEEIARYVDICREGMELERLLGLPERSGPPTYDLPAPKNMVAAVEQGSHVAAEERRRLGIGYQPIPDVADLITGQGIWASGAKLPDEMSGLFLRHTSIGIVILVNVDHARARKRFSYAHEYAHALIDRSRAVTVTTVRNHCELHEVRANAFAASFLLPLEGVWKFLDARQKAGPSRREVAVYDPSLETTEHQVKAQRRLAPGSQKVTYEDVAALAHHFGVSYQAAAFRLKSLGIVNQQELDALRGQEDVGRSYLRLLKMLDDLEGKDGAAKSDRELVSQVVHLALEAYRREEISQGKLRDLSSLLKLPAEKLLRLAEAA